VYIWTLLSRSELTLRAAAEFCGSQSPFMTYMRKSFFAGEINDLVIIFGLVALFKLFVTVNDQVLVPFFCVLQEANGATRA
jgi:hypothetical protein